MKIGVLALQGDFAEHIQMLKRLGVEGVEVRLPRDLEGVDGLIIPGGESTTIGKLAVQYNLIEPIRQLAETRSRPVWGTCAGAIFLSKDARRDQPLLNLMDIVVERNAFGRQVDSFETDLDVSALADPSKTADPQQMASSQKGDNGHPLSEDLRARPYHAIFIRAPLIESVGPGVDVLAQLPDGRIVAARQNNLLATSFHPELTRDERFHRYFLNLSA